MYWIFNHQISVSVSVLKIHTSVYVEFPLTVLVCSEGLNGSFLWVSPTKKLDVAKFMACKLCVRIFVLSQIIAVIMFTVISKH